jgi:hypothetical protein
LFLVPLWLALGLATVGLLWPPQVRRWVFSPTGATFRGWHSMSLTENELSRAKLSQLRADIGDLKVIAYEQNYQFQRDLGLLKDVLFRAVVDDDDYRHPKGE